MVAELSAVPRIGKADKLHFPHMLVMREAAFIMDENAWLHD